MEQPVSVSPISDQEIAMKKFHVCSGLFSVWLAVAGHAVAQVPAWHFEFAGGKPVKLVWQAAADRNYDLFFSADLGGWTHVDGFPKAGTGTTMEHSFTPGSRGFFRIAEDDGFALIPAGEFKMGDQSTSPRLGANSELPVHTVHVSAFYMAKFEVTVNLWDEVRIWGMSNLYTDLGTRGGKTNHPVMPPANLNWYSVLKWCNARSEKERLTPCYKVSGSVYRTGPADSGVVCNFGANGYRLPTEAEWEKAARGGLTGLNFPWGNTISQTQANYYSTNYSFESPQNQGYHPLFYGPTNWPYTSPPGSFAANGYGLYDMAGNVDEWCWDRYSSSYYASSPTTDPHGPDSDAEGLNRVIRGSSFNGNANLCRVAARWSGRPDSYLSNKTGFRVARSFVP